jgi:hypothetical protein
MEKNPDSGKYNLKSQLRTWSELKQQREEQRADPQRRRTLSHFLTEPLKSPSVEEKGKGIPPATHHVTHQEHSNLTAEPLLYDQTSTVGTPHEQNENEGHDYFATDRGRSLAIAMSKNPVRRATPEDVERWASESGMDSGKMADTLGDEPQPEEDLEQAETEDRSLQGSVY